jgi:hypothetical protein
LEKELGEVNDAYQESEKRIKKLNKEAADFGDTIVSSSGDVSDLDDALEGTQEASEKCGEGMANVDSAMAGVTAEGENFKNSLEDGSKNMVSWSNGLTNFATGATTFVAGMNMMTSSVQGLAEAFASGDLSAGDLLTNLGSLLSSVMMMVPALTQMKSGLTEVTTAILTKILATKAETVVEDESNKNAGKTVAADGQKKASKLSLALGNIGAAFSGIAAQAGTGPAGWATAIASLAMVVPIALMVGASVVSIGKGAGAAKEEEQQETVDTGLENLEAIDENQELAASVSDLTSEYKALNAAGMDTTDILDEMNEKIPELINSYKELGT